MTDIWETIEEKAEQSGQREYMRWADLEGATVVGVRGEDHQTKEDNTRIVLAKVQIKRKDGTKERLTLPLSLSKVGLFDKMEKDERFEVGGVYAIIVGAEEAITEGKYKGKKYRKLSIVDLEGELPDESNDGIDPETDAVDEMVDDDLI